MSDTLRVEIANGPNAGRTMEIPQGGMVIGRSGEADVTVKDASLSRKHCRIYRRDAATWCVEDLGSSNGTRVNGTKYTAVDILPGDRLRLGRIELLIAPEAAPSAAAAGAADAAPDGGDVTPAVGNPAVGQETHLPSASAAVPPQPDPSTIRPALDAGTASPPAAEGQADDSRDTAITPAGSVLPAGAPSVAPGAGPSVGGIDATAETDVQRNAVRPDAAVAGAQGPAPAGAGGAPAGGVAPASSGGSGDGALFRRDQFGLLAIVVVAIFAGGFITWLLTRGGDASGDGASGDTPPASAAAPDTGQTPAPSSSEGGESASTSVGRPADGAETGTGSSSGGGSGRAGDAQTAGGTEATDTEAPQRGSATAVDDGPEVTPAIRANEAAVVEALRKYVIAQEDYKRANLSRLPANGGGGAESALQYAKSWQHLGGATAHRNEGGEALEAIPAGMAAADSPETAWNGYYFRDMRFVDFKPINRRYEHALCAIPAEYGKTGLHTFIVKSDGVVFRKDLRGSSVLDWPRDPEGEGWRMP